MIRMRRVGDCCTGLFWKFSICPDHCWAWCFFALIAFAGQPSCYIPRVTAKPQGGLESSHLILVQPPGFSCCFDIVLDHNIWKKSQPWSLPLKGKWPSTTISNYCKLLKTQLTARFAIPHKMALTTVCFLLTIPFNLLRSLIRNIRCTFSSYSLMKNTCHRL